MTVVKFRCNRENMQGEHISAVGAMLVDTTATGCVVELVPEGEPRESRARQIFYPWSAIRSIELREESPERRESPTVAQPAEPPEYPVP